MAKGCVHDHLNVTFRVQITRLFIMLPESCILNIIGQLFMSITSGKIFRQHAATLETVQHCVCCVCAEDNLNKFLTTNPHCFAEKKLKNLNWPSIGILIHLTACHKFEKCQPCNLMRHNLCTPFRIIISKWRWTNDPGTFCSYKM